MEISKQSFFFIIFILLSCFKINFTQAQPSRFSYNKFANGKGDTLNYRMMQSDYDTFRKYPLVIFLHGSGERGNDNDAQLKWGVMNFATDQMMATHPAVVIAPQCPAGQSWSNFTRNDKNRDMGLIATPSKPMELLFGLINELKKNRFVDTNRIYITGLSMGGYGTFDALARYPNLFAAAVPVCGGGDVSKVPTFAHIPIWIFHGADDSSVPPLNSVDMVNALFKAGAHPGFTLYPEVGHFSWLSAYNDALMYEWLFRQHK